MAPVKTGAPGRLTCCELGLVPIVQHHGDDILENTENEIYHELSPFRTEVSVQLSNRPLVWLGGIIKRNYILAYIHQ